ncbi:MAG: Do family serine endopeptidase [Proteobacteria bacterium]|nr:Do family serine endopeptidase [Pseudomonadota bacterium]MBU4258886.1 Do family serine endopeptidase [Pseudomonadota bacterium]MBU4288919.1 Do family serine endopeptidase [Pseudomonadota bacterium]MBU4415276.1 Do family serine endopeptidase [Pseudomonadota bacterium]MCG2758369.1 Do family serine endopeptidase [Desulfobacteraceae bacterium]
MTKLTAQINKKLIKSIISFFVTVNVVFFAPLNCLCFEYKREDAVVKAVRKVSPAVVNISSEFEVSKRINPFSGFGIDPFFDSFFKDFFDPGLERRQKRTSLGSGVIIDGKRGFILTNSHVITKTGTITVTLKDEREFTAKVVGADPDSDLAVLQITSKDPLPAIEMGSSEDIMIGETVIAIGNPFGFSNTVTTGVISAKNRSIRTEDRVFHDFIQIDASINPGNSGGPLLNINGELIGINTAIYAKAQGIGFAIPINKAKRIISDLIQYGEVIQPWIGLTIQNLDKRLAQYLKVPGNKGVLVKEVAKNSPSHKAGIHDGDIIISIGTRKIHSNNDYRTALKDSSAGNTIKINLWRNGKALNVSLVAAVFPLDLAGELAYQLMGIRTENMSSRKPFAYKITAKQGVIITEINRQSYLYRIGVRPGDIIRQIDEINVKNLKDFEGAIVKYRHKTSVVILLQRGDQGYYISVKL